MKDIGVVIHLLRRKNDKFQILFLCRSWGLYENQWWPIAGNIKTDESPAMTAFREIKEETGIVPESLYDSEMTVPHVGPNAKPDETIHIYVGFVPPDVTIRLNHEHTDFKWIDFDQAKNIVEPKAADITEYVFSCVKEKFINNVPPPSSRIMPPS